MPAKNLYIKDADKPVWDEAEASSQDSLSNLITSLLRQYLDQQKRQQESLQDMERIEFEFEDQQTGRVTKKAFQGRWVIPPNQEFVPECTNIQATAAAAVTAKRQIFFGWFDKDNQVFSDFSVFDSVKAAEDEGISADVLGPVADELGEDFVEELDI